MPIQFIASPNGKRLMKVKVPEPTYVWLSISLLAQGDVIIVAQQEVSVQALSHQDEIWYVRMGELGTRNKGNEEMYRSHQFLYTKTTDMVKARLKKTSRENK